MSDIQISERALDAAVFAIQRALMFKVKEGKEEQFRNDMRFVLQQVAEAERLEAEEASTLGDMTGLGEALHTGWRKGTDSPYSTAIHKLITEMHPAHWQQYLEWVHWALGESGYRPPERKQS